MEGGVSARRIGMLATIAVMAASGTYVFVYLYRWEWNRALISAAIFVAAEVGLVATVLFERLARIDRRMQGLTSTERPIVDERVRRRLQENVPEAANPFAWLTRSQTNVFVPVLLGAGVVLSGLAWLVDRIARATAGPVVEGGLVRRLSALQPPAGGLLGGRPAEPYRPRRANVER
jgi:hypothetical protein